MAKKIKKIALRYVNDGLIILMAVIFQVSFLSSFQRPISLLNIALSFVIFFTLVVSYKRGLALALVAGFILDIYTLHTFGSIMASFFLTVVIINILFDHFFTNRSYFSLLVLGTLGSVFFALVFPLLDGLGFLLQVSDFRIALTQEYFFHSFLAVPLNALLIVLIFGIFNFLSKRAKSVFLISE